MRQKRLFKQPNVSLRIHPAQWICRYGKFYFHRNLPDAVYPDRGDVGSDIFRLVLRAIGWTAIVAVMIPVSLAFATQTHGGMEGLFVHQVAHLFFVCSMGLLIYWLRKRNLVTHKGWRYIQVAAVFFIAWNLYAVFFHFGRNT